MSTTRPESIYQNTAGKSTYLANNPTWHAEHSHWKANHIHSMLQKSRLAPNAVAEIGCGAGEILNQLRESMPETTRFFGYDISDDAIRMAQTRAKDRLEYFHDDLFQTETIFDLLLAIDVFEHIDDYFAFLRKCRDKATYKLFNIPLEMTWSTLYRPKTLQHARDTVGHLHFFSKTTALLALENTGHEIIDTRLASYRLETTDSPWKIRVPLKIMQSLVGSNLAATFMGGYTLFVLTK